MASAGGCRHRAIGWPILTLAVVFLCSGCTHCQLRRSTTNQEGTLPDLLFHEVLDNVARFQCNPGTLPYFAYASFGNSQVTDSGTATGGLGWDARSIVSETLGLNAERSVVEGWNLIPINDPGRLLAMRYAYQRLVGCQEPDGDARLCEFFRSGINLDEKLPVGWYCSSCKKKCPDNACYSACYGKTCVWVMPENMDAFSKFTLAILDIATLARQQSATQENRKTTAAAPGGANQSTSPPLLLPRDIPIGPSGPQFYPTPR